MTDEVMLKSCPFCGAGQAQDADDLTGVWVEKTAHDEPDIHVHCWSCGARGKEWSERNAAIAAWNTRAPIDRSADLQRHIAWQEGTSGDRDEGYARVTREAASLVYPIEVAGALEHEGDNFARWKETARRIAPSLRAALADRQPDQRGGKTFREALEEIATSDGIGRAGDIARAALSSFAPDWPEKWAGALTVGNMIANLRTLPADMPIHSAYHVVRADQPSLLFVKTPTVSRERVDGRTIKMGDESVPYSAVVWSHCRTPEEDGQSDQRGGEVAVLAEVQAERDRQAAIGWTAEHDDEHRNDRALSRAAACYALADPNSGDTGPFWITHLRTPHQVWPYRWEWKPKDRRRNLIRAAALLVAEIERFDRAAAPRPAEQTGEG